MFWMFSVKQSKAIISDLNTLRCIWRLPVEQKSIFAPFVQVQLSQRDCAAGRVSFGQKWKTRTGRQYFTDIIGLSSTTVT